jgi:hypothetical protein
MQECILSSLSRRCQIGRFSRMMGQTSNRVANEYVKSALLRLHAFASCPCAAEPRSIWDAIWHITKANTDYPVKGIDYIDQVRLYPLKF